MRLIDADALKEQILDWISEQVVSKYISHDACMATREGARVAFNLLNEAPTIDAVPVVRGYSYEDDKTYSGPGTSNYICSVCGEMQGTWKKGLAQNQKFKFCPWCGAKMEDKPCE